MKQKLLLLILAAILLVTVAANAVPALINHGYFAREIPDQPMEYPIQNIQIPSWWPH